MARWHHAIIGSISHNDTDAVAGAIAQADQGESGVGIDIESVRHPDRVHQCFAVLALAAERMHSFHPHQFDVDQRFLLPQSLRWRLRFRVPPAGRYRLPDAPLHRLSFSIVHSTCIDQ